MNSTPKGYAVPTTTPEERLFETRRRMELCSSKVRGAGVQVAEHHTSPGMDPRTRQAIDLIYKAAELLEEAGC